MSEYFPKLFKHFHGNVKVELDLSHYATKPDLKGATEVDKCNLAAKSDLASVKAGVDKTDLDELKIVSADLSKVSNSVGNDDKKLIN